MKHQHIYDLCKQHMHSYVLAETEDGNKFDGILTGLDDEYAYFAIPMDSGTGQNNHISYHHGMMDHEHGAYHSHYGGNMPNDHHHYPGYNHHTSFGQREDNQAQRYGYGYPGYGGGYPGYGYPPRRFSRLVLPLAALVALTALPWY